MHFFLSKSFREKRIPLNLLAKRLQEKGHVDIFYGGLDGLSLSYSGMKLLQRGNILEHAYKVSRGSSKLDAPSIKIVPILGTTCVSFFSILANFPKGKSKRILKPLLAVWPYCRDAFKSLKSAQKTIRTVVELAAFLNRSHLSIDSFFLPLSIIGILSRIGVRYTLQKQKNIINQQELLLRAIQKKPFISKDIHEAIENNYLLAENYLNKKKIIFLSVLINGFFDNFSMYFGLLLVSSLSPNAMLIALSLSAIYSLTSLLVRVDEECRRQKAIKLNQVKIKLALLSKELSEAQDLYLKHNSLIDYQKSLPAVECLWKAIKKLQKNLAQFNHQYGKIFSLYSEDFAVVSSGLRNGLAAYGVLLSFLSAARQFFTFNCGVMIVASGLFFIGFFIAYSFKKFQSLEPSSGTNQNEVSLILLEEQFFQNLRENVLISHLAKTQDSIREMISPVIVPQEYIEACLEIMRSFFSGVNKGLNLSCFITKLTGFSEHYIFARLSALIYAIILATRVFIKTFGKLPLKDTDDKENYEESLEKEPFEVIAYQEVSKVENSISIRNRGELLPESFKCSFFSGEKKIIPDESTLDVIMIPTQ